MGACNSGNPQAPPPLTFNVCQCQQDPPQPTRKLLVLTVPLHCPNCALKVKRKLHDVGGVETVDVDVRNSRVTVAGTMDTASLVLTIFRRFRKQAQILLESEEGERWRRRWERNEYKSACESRTVQDGGDSCYVDYHQACCGCEMKSNCDLPRALCDGEYWPNCSVV